MARIAYGNVEDPHNAALVERITAERGRVGDLYRMLLNSPAVCEGWLAFLTAIRQRCLLDARYREMVIIRVAELNGAEHEKRSHLPHARDAGLTDEDIAALSDWNRAPGFDEVDRAVLAYADAMTLDVHVSDVVFNAVNRHFDEREMTELTATIAAYNLVSRFLVALHVGH